MTRHGKNNTASSVYSYHERQQDKESGGYGLQRKRLGKDSIKDFNACNLTLQPCRNPVLTREGYLYDKESILEYIIHQKVEIAKQLKKYEKEKKKEEQELRDLAEKERADKANKFSKKEMLVFREKSGSSSSGQSTISNMSLDNSSKLPSFWIPDLTPSSSKDKIKKPSKNVLCPMSGKPLKANELISITFTPIDPKVTDPKKATYKCAVSHDVLDNRTTCVVLKTSGSVVTKECYDTIIKKEMIDPTNGKPLKESDVLHLQRGGTGYSSSNELVAETKKPVLMA